MTDSPESIVTPELRGWIGRTSKVAYLETMSASDVRRYVDATGDKNPLWLDDDFARTAGYRSRLLPPTLVGWVPFSMKEGDSASGSDATDLRRLLPLPRNYTNVRNAGSETEWLQPAYVGEQLSTQSRIVDIAAPHAPREVASFVPPAPEGHKRVSSNDVCFDRRGLLYLIDRGRGLHILERV
jgi:acyl dehydratase